MSVFNSLDIGNDLCILKRLPEVASVSGSCKALESLLLFKGVVDVVRHSKGMTKESMISVTVKHLT
jgi:hypothetical protein